MAAELTLKWTLGGPPPAVDPDTLDAHELSVKRGRPTLIDQLALTDDPAEDDPEARPATEDADDPDLPPPPLQAMLSWALRELAEAQTRIALPSPPDPSAGWETFAASRLEFAPEAAVEVDQLLLAYLRWCASHGELALEEAKVMAALQAHGARVHTGPLSQVTTVQGVRVMQ
jgi:hypothetical protein